MSLLSLLLYHTINFIFITHYISYFSIEIIIIIKKKKIWGMRKHYSTLEVRTILADANFENLARGEMRWEGDHLRIILTVNDSKAIDNPIVSEHSAKLRKIGCRCVLDDGLKELVRCSLPIACSNRFHSLKDDDVTIKKRDCVEVPQGGLQSRSAYHREY